MSNETRVWAALSFGVGLILVQPAFAQGTAATASTPLGSADSVASSSQSTPTPTPAQPAPLVITPPGRSADQPTYSVGRPEGSSGIYLPAAVLGYTRSAVGCVVVGCDDGPQVHVSSEPPVKPVDLPVDSKSPPPR
jgi:hypothetical protein